MGLGIVVLIFLASLPGADGSAATDSGCTEALGCTLSATYCTAAGVPGVAGHAVAQVATPVPAAREAGLHLAAVGEDLQHLTSMC